MESWLTKDLKQRIRDVFESKYKKQLSDEDVVEIARNLTSTIEIIVKLRWKNIYGNELV